MSNIGGSNREALLGHVLSIVAPHAGAWIETNQDIVDKP
jgi:hypothetical protein